MNRVERGSCFGSIHQPAGPPQAPGLEAAINIDSFRQIDVFPRIWVDSKVTRIRAKSYTCPTLVSRKSQARAEMGSTTI